MSGTDIEFVRIYVARRWFRAHKRPSQIVFDVEKRFGMKISLKTVRRWLKKSKLGWDYQDKSRKPHTIHTKVTPEQEAWIAGYRRRTDYDAGKIRSVLLRDRQVALSESTIKRIIARNSLSRGSKMKGMRLKWVRWQRDTPNSLWQMDHTEEFDKTLRLVVEDDCSRFCLGILHTKRLATKDATAFLGRIIATYGKPRQILTDHGAIYQKEFDKWCKRRGIEHIMGRVNKPTTCGKVEKLHDTYNREIHKFRSPEEFRWSYNSQRPHESLDYKTPSELYNEFHRLLFFERKD